MDKFLHVGLVTVLGLAFASFVLYGFPKDMISLTTPLTLVLLVISLHQQTQAQKQAREDNLFAAQVQALVALIEDDRSKLASMQEKSQETGKKDPRFLSIVARKKDRIKKLNELLLHRDLMAGAVADDSEAHA